MVLESVTDGAADISVVGGGPISELGTAGSGVDGKNGAGANGSVVDNDGAGSGVDGKKGAGASGVDGKNGAGANGADVDVGIAGGAVDGAAGGSVSDAGEDGIAGDGCGGGGGVADAPEVPVLVKNTGNSVVQP